MRIVMAVGFALLVGLPLAGCISSSNPSPPPQTIVVPPGTVLTPAR
ncbi:hypothetical protein [Siccirubricoccus deserti]|uniref:Uncharacterized protein n=1 Tax=Siccirubricoccus deserti TaxID=2013562 RepID=A0A9X0QWM0_9PROT|nr:hypothetical protein [Siccirubricoccus deserti]MBC4015276.1 hypothetical protein [Siccirubricoccus deserti]